MNFCEQIGLKIPVIQAGMGGGITTGQLVGTVSAHGGLGTVGIMGARGFDATLAEARERAGSRPLAANLLTPFVHGSHVRACARHGVNVVTILGGTGERWIRALHAHNILVHITVGTAEQARSALAAGADGLVAQGIEAGGHHMAVEPLDITLKKVLAVAGDMPVVAAGGVATADDVRDLLKAGASAVISGTRFLLTRESGAHPEYQRRVLEAKRTLRTQVFGFGWPLPHRVIPNEVTQRWCQNNDMGPRWIQTVGRITAPTSRLLPLSMLGTIVAMQRVGGGLFTAGLPLRSMPASAVTRSALYAGESLHRMHGGVISAAEALAQLTP